MPHIFYNIDFNLLPHLKSTPGIFKRTNFCVGFFNSRSWRHLDSCIKPWAGTEEERRRLLVGIQRAPQDDLRGLLRLTSTDPGASN